jgi:hypothetical protein
MSTHSVFISDSSQIRQIQRAARTLFTEDCTPLAPFHKRGRQYVLWVTDDVAVESLSSHRPATKSLGQGQATLTGPLLERKRAGGSGGGGSR